MPLTRRPLPSALMRSKSQHSYSGSGAWFGGYRKITGRDQHVDHLPVHRQVHRRFNSADEIALTTRQWVTRSAWLARLAGLEPGTATRRPPDSIQTPWRRQDNGAEPYAHLRATSRQCVGECIVGCFSVAALDCVSSAWLRRRERAAGRRAGLRRRAVPDQLRAALGDDRHRRRQPAATDGRRGLRRRPVRRCDVVLGAGPGRRSPGPHRHSRPPGSGAA